MAEEKPLTLDGLPKMMAVLSGPISAFVEAFLSMIPVEIIQLSPKKLELDNNKLKPFKDLDPTGKQIRIDQAYTRALNSKAKLVIINVPSLSKEDHSMYERLAKSNGFILLKLTGTLDISKEILADLKDAGSPLIELAKPEAPVVAIDKEQQKPLTIKSLAEELDIKKGLFGSWDNIREEVLTKALEKGLITTDGSEIPNK